MVEYLAAIDDGEVSVAELHVACILARGQKGSHDSRFKVRLHYPLHPELCGDSAQFIQPEAFAAPRVRQRLQCHIEADLIPESKAVRDGPSAAVDMHGLSLHAMLLDAKVEHCRRDVDDPEGRPRKTRHSRATRNGNPNVGRKLRSDVVESKGRDQGVTVSDAQMAAIRIRHHRFHGEWDYTIHPVPSKST